MPESEYYETLGGMIAYTIGEIPEQGEEIELSPYILKIKKVSATKLNKSYFQNQKITDKEVLAIDLCTFKGKRLS